MNNKRKASISDIINIRTRVIPQSDTHAPKKNNMHPKEYSRARFLMLQK